MTMGSSTALVAKVRGRFGKYLNPIQLHNMVQETDTAGVLRCIRAIVGPDAGPFDDVVSCERELESWKRRRNAELLHFLDTKERDFIQSFLVQDELLELQRFLRVLQRQNREEQMSFVLHSIYANTLNLTTDTTVDVAAYLATLQDKAYYRLLEPMVLNDTKAKDLNFDTLSVNSARWYYHRLREEAKSFSGNRAKVLNDFLGVMIDLRNLTRIFHVKKFVPQEDAFLQLQMIDGGKSIHGKELDTLVAQPLAMFLEQMEKTPYHALFEGGEVEYSFLPIATQRYLYHFCQRIFRTTGDGLLAALCFIVMLQGRMAEIRRILEAKSLGFKEEQMIQYLIEWRTE